MGDWEINKPLGQCYGNGRKIEYGEEYFGALVETEEGLQRRDFCTEYWESEKPEVFCRWKTRLPEHVRDATSSPAKNLLQPSHLLPT